MEQAQQVDAVGPGTDTLCGSVVQGQRVGEEAAVQKISVFIMPQFAEDEMPIHYKVPKDALLRRLLKKLSKRHRLDSTKGLKLCRKRKRLSPALTVEQAGIQDGDMLDAFFSQSGGGPGAVMLGVVPP